MTSRALSCVPRFEKSMAGRHVVPPGRATFATRPVLRRSGPVDKLKGILDFSKGKRAEVLHEFYGNVTNENFDKLLDDDFVLFEEGGTNKYSKADFKSMMLDRILPAIPDYSWGHATNGEVDKNSYAIVTVAASGHHTGEEFALPGTEPCPPTGKHFCLAEEVHKVKVENNKIKEIQVLPSKGAGPRALYQVLKANQA